MAMEELIALRLSKEELAQLDKLVLLSGKGNRSVYLRSLVAQDAEVLDLARWEKLIVLDPVVEES